MFEIVVRSRSFEEIRKNLKVKTQTTTHAFRKNISHSVQKKYSKLHYTSIRNLTQTNGKNIKMRLSLDFLGAGQKQKSYKGVAATRR